MRANYLFIKILIAVVVLFPKHISSQPSTEHNRPIKIEKLMNAVGGDSVWANAQGFRMLEIANDDRYELPLIREFWIDFKKPRIKITTKSSVRNQTSSLNINKGSTLKHQTNNLEVWDNEKVKLWNSFWPGIPTRIFHLIASQDASLSYEINSNRIDFYINNNFTVWISTNNNGIPIAYGRNENYEEIHILGDFMSYGPVKLWKEAIEPGGKWSVIMADYELLNDMSKISYEND